MNPANVDRLRAIKTFPQLVAYLRDELEWPIDPGSFEESTFDYDPAAELGLDAKTAAKVQEVKQLRPLAHGQPWGVFFVKFEPKRLPVVALRRLLAGLVVTNRASSRRADRAAWKMNDLLFISQYGEADERQISFAHFAEEAQDDLPTLRVVGWDGDDTAIKLDHVHKELVTKMRFQSGDEANPDAWRKRWASAFVLAHREVVRTSAELAVELAHLAQRIRRKVNAALAIESEKGPLRKLMSAFRSALIQDLTEDDFADMYAQTIAYGLLTARISRHAGPGEPGVLSADNLVAMVPVTNPFLGELFQTFLHLGGRRNGKGKNGHIDFDELGVSEVVELLNRTNMDAVLRDFGNRNPQEDPVIHFYELFLKEYDARKRMHRGVFYTPRPVVSYIVRSVDELLRTEFGLADGLADTTTWGEMMKRHKDLKIPKGVSSDQDFVQVLDPATGTGTFLVEAIDLIHKTLAANWKAQGHDEKRIDALWNEYVPKHLLTRLHGYELLMAPYAIAHLKIGLKLYETGYQFGSDERARVYLTNALEPAHDFSGRFEFAIPALAHEANAVNEIKQHKCFTVVIGNPPYAGISSNMTDYALRIVDAYKFVDGSALNERKLWLQDDYVKFIRKAQTTIESASVGVLGFITNHGYFDNPTFRGMRQSLNGTFQQMSVLDLHGNANKKEESPDGTDDKNVFDIKQGVGICLATRGGDSAVVKHADLWGSRETKYGWLGKNSVGSTEFSTLAPDSPFYLFVPRSNEHRQEYEGWIQITDAMPLTSAGFITARDRFVIDLERANLAARMTIFGDPSVTTDEVRKLYFDGRGSEKYADGDTRGWKLSDARRAVQKDSQRDQRIRKCLYRPFDERFIYWATWMIDWPRPEVMGQMIAGDNLALITSRMTKGEIFAHAQVTRNISEVICMSAKTSNNGFVFPLWIREEAIGLDLQVTKADDSSRRPNFSHTFTKAISKTLNLPPTKPHDLPADLTPEDIFHYVYAVFHSPGYRRRYAEFLKIDFPRLPLTGNLELFRALARLGGELTPLHLLESPKLDKPFSEYIGGRNPDMIEKVSWSKNTVWLDKAQTTGFKGVCEEVWNFHIGGYQVCEKWLKDRRGRTLSDDDILHYQKIVVALNETIRIMKEIDDVIEKHGGWPGAFSPGVDQ